MRLLHASWQGPPSRHNVGLFGNNCLHGAVTTGVAVVANAVASSWLLMARWQAGCVCYVDSSLHENVD
jgi:hypothetical protein